MKEINGYHISMENKEFIKDLIKFIDDSPVSYYAVENARKILKENGYTELFENEKWDIKERGKYFVVRDGTALFAINLGEDIKDGFDIIGSHTESPTPKLKSNPEMAEMDILS